MCASSPHKLHKFWFQGASFPKGGAKKVIRASEENFSYSFIRQKKYFFEACKSFLLYFDV